MEAPAAGPWRELDALTAAPAAVAPRKAVLGPSAATALNIRANPVPPLPKPPHPEKQQQLMLPPQMQQRDIQTPREAAPRLVPSPDIAASVAAALRDAMATKARNSIGARAPQRRRAGDSTRASELYEALAPNDDPGEPYNKRASTAYGERGFRYAIGVRRYVCSCFGDGADNVDQLTGCTWLRIVRASRLRPGFRPRDNSCSAALAYGWSREPSCAASARATCDSVDE